MLIMLKNISRIYVQQLWAFKLYIPNCEVSTIYSKFLTPNNEPKPGHTSKKTVIVFYIHIISINSLSNNPCTAFVERSV